MRKFAQQTSRWLSLLAFWLACFLGVLATTPAAANGIPVQVYLDYTPFKATWQPATAARGVAVVSANDEQVRVMAQDLPAPPSGQVYYAWLEKAEGGFLPVGTLKYNDDGTASIDQHMEALPYSENFSWVLIALEQPEQMGNAPAPEIALAGRLPNPLALPPRGNELPALLPVTGGNTAPPIWTAYGWVGIAGALALLISFVVHRHKVTVARLRVKRQQKNSARGQQ